MAIHYDAFVEGVPPASITDLVCAAAQEALTERDQRVFELRFGLVDGSRRTLEEIGVEIEVTREQVEDRLKLLAGDH